jgi:hypothetical protein
VAPAVIPARTAAVTRVVQVALAITPSIAVARRTIEQWAGHPADAALREDALELLGRIEAEARQT